MHIPRAICGNDGWEMQIEKTGILVEMHAKWGSYYKVYGDKFYCTQCDSSVILAVPNQDPAIMHRDPNYALYRADMQGTFLD